MADSVPQADGLRRVRFAGVGGSRETYSVAPGGPLAGHSPVPIHPDGAAGGSRIVGGAAEAGHRADAAPQRREDLQRSGDVGGPTRAGRALQSAGADGPRVEEEDAEG